MMNNSVVLGVDIGGSHITAALVNLETMTLLPKSQFREYVNAKETSDQIISIWNRVIHKSFSAYPVKQKTIGIAMPGPFDYIAGISLMKGQEKFDHLYGQNLKNILAHTLGIASTNIQFINDAECFLRGEVFGGAAKNFSKAIGLTLGTGLGSSIYENGISKNADLWCSAFQDGLAEDYLSTRWFTKEYHIRTGRHVQNVKELVERRLIESVVDEIFKDFGKNLALFLNDFILKQCPEVVVIGGNIANAFELFRQSMLDTISMTSVQPALRRAVLGE